MTFLGCEGFDTGIVDSNWLVAAGTFGSAGNGRNGTSSFRTTASTAGELRRTFLPAEQTADLIIGFAIRPAVVAAAYDIIRFEADATATTHVTIRCNSGQLQAYRGLPTTTLLGSTVGNPLVANTWVYLEIQVKLHDTTGYVKIWADGVQVLNLTGIDTKNAGTNTVLESFLLLGTVSGVIDFEDMYWASNDGVGVTAPVGDVTVETLLPNGDGATNPAVGSDGNSVSNWQLVDDAVMTDYVDDGTLNDVELYALTDLTRTSGTVYGVTVVELAQKTDSGTRGITPAIRSSSTTSLGTEKTLTTGAAGFGSSFPVDPATSAAWTISGVNALQAGFKVTT